ncbi:unnamed protein product [Paramecium sonneborni]|uniref:Uncharacterized protein n=1 Tax=Paramecium sonneborni TaxID=65129 RepID=A0A8S1QMS3_9CILI|nr:unnamed protein product [Paramecium sonneborni]
MKFIEESIKNHLYIIKFYILKNKQINCLLYKISFLVPNILTINKIRRSNF